MKFRESGMPDETMWDTFFDPEAVLVKLGLKKDCDLLVDVGCGYGTFLIPAAGYIRGRVIGMDIDQQMVDYCTDKITGSGLNNVEIRKQDLFSDGYGIDQGTVDSVFLFNLLHCEEPTILLKETFAVLKQDGRLYVIHWNYDESTPRGPSMDIRPRPEQIIDWAIGAGFILEKQIDDIETYHYGLIFTK